MLIQTGERPTKRVRAGASWMLPHRVTDSRQGSAVATNPTGQHPPSTGSRVHLRAADPEAAEQAVADVYLPNTVTLPRGDSSLALDLVAARYGGLTVGQLTYGREVQISTPDTEAVHINLPLRGQSSMRSGTGPESHVEPGAGAVFRPGAPVHVSMSADCVLLSLMVSRASLEEELSRLLGRSLVQPLQLDFDLDLHGELGRAWDPAVKLMRSALHDPTPLTEHPVAARHVEALVLDGLLLGHRHSYRELLDAPACPGAAGAIARATELLAADPGAGWTTVRLASEVHLSVRALQAGFRRDLGQSPMAYLRQLRLQRAHDLLVAATPGSTTVRLEATRLGLLHLGRFAAAYRETYGESPMETLRRPPPG